MGYNLEMPSSPRDDALDLDAVRRELEDRRQHAHERLAALTARPERGSAVGFGKRIGDGTSEAVSRLTDVGVGGSLERGMHRTEHWPSSPRGRTEYATTVAR
jgi:hypothetical protein